MARPQALERNKEIVLKAKQGAKQKDLARHYRVSEGRISQIIKLYGKL